MSDIERYKKHNKQPTNLTDPKTKDIDFGHLVPNDELTFDKEMDQAILESVIDPMIKHKNYLEEQNCKEKTYKFIMFLLAFLGIIIGLVTIRYDLIKIISYFFHASN